MRVSLLTAAVFFLSVSFLFSQNADEIDLAGVAAFRIGDDDTWRSKYIDERENWSFVRIPGSWENQGSASLDGFAWYRLRFHLPTSFRDDSLLLIIDCIDDVDETFLNGWHIGNTGSFPPDARSECKTMRVYPLPKRMREEYNVLAIRVYDVADSGGLNGRTLRIIRAKNLQSFLQTMPKEETHPPNLFLSNGQCLASFHPEKNRIESFYPHVFHEFEQDLFSENILHALTIGFEFNGKETSLDSLRADRTEYYQNTSIIHQEFPEEIEAFWYIPRTSRMKILIAMLQYPRDLDVENVKLSMMLLRQTIAVREIKKQIGRSTRHYFVLAYNSCCKEYAERDLDEFLRTPMNASYRAEDIESEMMYWGKIRASLRVPANLTEDEKAIFKQSATMILMAQNSEVGSGAGEIISAFQPKEKKYCHPHDHHLATAALAQCGLIDEAKSAIDFSLRQHGMEYLFYDVYGDEYGVGIPYQVTPAKYLGSGDEYRWKEKLDARLSNVGAGSFLVAFHSYATRKKREEAYFGSIITDSMILARSWNTLSKKVADPLIELIDSTSLLRKDAGLWATQLSPRANIHSSLWAAAGLRIASRFSSVMHDSLHAFIYKTEAEKIIRRIESLIRSMQRKSTAEELSALENLLFHPMLSEALSLDVLPANHASAKFILEIVERSFGIKDQKNSFLTVPNGDWFDRLERPYIALTLATANAKLGSVQRAEELFQSVTDIARRNFGMLPELRDTDSKNWYGGVPSIAQGAAAYIQTAIAMSELRQARSKMNNSK